MREKLKNLSPLWAALTAVALVGVIVFAVLVGVGASAAGARDPFPVPAASGAARMAEDDAYFVAADAEGELSCYNKTDGALLFSYRKPTAEDGGADVLSVSLYGGQVFALYSDRQVLRFAADGDGVPAGALETNYVPQQAYFPASGSLFAVYGTVGSRKEVYLLRTDFGGTPAAPVSYREYPKLDGGEYAVSSGGVETGVQGICVTEDGYVYVASDIYTVRRFTANGMEDGYEQYDVPAQKLAAFCETETGFAGMDLAGNFYRFDDTFQTEYTLRTGQAFDTVLCAEGTFYGVGGGRVVGVRSDEGVLFNIAAEGDSLVLAREDAFVLSGGGDARYIGVALARRQALFAGLLSLYIPLLVVLALFAVFAGLHAWRSLGARVNCGLAVCGKTFVKHKLAYIGLIPTFALLAVFYYWPILRGFGLSFFNYNGVTSQFVGLQNFIDVLKNTIFWNSTLNMFILLVTDLGYTRVGERHLRQRQLRVIEQYLFAVRTGVYADVDRAVPRNALARFHHHVLFPVGRFIPHFLRRRHGNPEIAVRSRGVGRVRLVETDGDHRPAAHLRADQIYLYHFVYCVRAGLWQVIHHRPVYGAWLKGAGAYHL